MAQLETQSFSPTNFDMVALPINQQPLNARNLFPPPPSSSPEFENRTSHRRHILHKTTSGDTLMHNVTEIDFQNPDHGMRDEESENTNDSSSTLGKKKGKSQKFFCDDFPPCNLSFTRSEHLARHIRKHTGERPFQCHCSRRFSRLDNLRQHAQTVHQNEEIPEDSLAATGTRFQRQVRNTTDRPRPVGGRTRGNTVSSQTSGNNRIHKRNSLSTSSIGSVSSSYSSSHGITDRKRPLPLMLTASATTGEYASSCNSAGGCFSSNSSSSGGGGGGGPGDVNKLAQESPSCTLQSRPGSRSLGYPSHPNLSSFSMGVNIPSSLGTRSNESVNPAWTAITGLQSPPTSSHSRTASDSQWSHLSRPSRRLSVPLAMGIPAFPHPATSSPPSSSNSMQLASVLSTCSANLPTTPSQPLSKGIPSSPTENTIKNGISTLPPRENPNTPDESSRRRTWHPDTNMSIKFGANSHSGHPSSSYPTPDLKSYQPQVPIHGYHPPQLPTTPMTPMRLPGIESFGPLQTSQSPSRHKSNIFRMLDSPRSSLLPTPSREHSYQTSNSPQLDQVINRNMYRLELSGHDVVNSWT